MVLGSSLASIATCDGKAMYKAEEHLQKPKSVQLSGAIDESKLNYQILKHDVDKLMTYSKFTKTIHNVLFSDQFVIAKEDEVVDRV